jgi:hypothetical protein
MVVQYEVSTGYKIPKIFITAVTLVITIFIVGSDFFFQSTICSVPSRASLISHFLKDLPHVSQSMSSHKSVNPITCPFEISNTICDHPSSCFKNKKLLDPETPQFLWFVVQLPF